jgi:drug/metabolite transporter (DMT)-like permease
MNVSNKTAGHLACFLAYSIFGLNIIICRDLTSGSWLSPLAIFSLRSVFAATAFWILSIFSLKESVEKQDFLKIFGGSVFGFLLTQLTFLKGIAHITPMDCSIVTALSPIFTMFIAAIVLKEPITLKKAGGVMLSLAGLIFLIFNSAGNRGGTTETETIGLILMILNILCFSLYLGLFKTVIGKYSVVTFMKWIFLFSTLMSLPFSAKELIATDYAALPSNFFWELGYLVFFATIVAYYLIPVGQKSLRPTLVSMYSYVQPIIATTVSIIIGMDILTWQKVIATIAVFSGVILVNKSRAKQE